MSVSKQKVIFLENFLSQINDCKKSKTIFIFVDHGSMIPVIFTLIFQINFDPIIWLAVVWYVCNTCFENPILKGSIDVNCGI